MGIAFTKFRRGSGVHTPALVFSVRQHLCECGETDPDRFYAGQKGRCKACVIKRVSERDKQNPERLRKRVNSWRSANRDRSREINRKSQARNPDTHNKSEASRRARKRGAQIVDHVDRLIVLERDDGVCGICGGDVDPFNFHVDHIVPLVKGGDHSYSNCQTAHPACNIGKGDRGDQNRW